MDKPPGYWEAYFREQQNYAQAEFLNISMPDDPDMVKTNAWAKVAEGWRELADYHGEEGT